MPIDLVTGENGKLLISPSGTLYFVSANPRETRNMKARARAADEILRLKTVC